MGNTLFSKCRKSQHHCDQDCFDLGRKAAVLKQLQDVLQEYHARSAVHTILEFLPDYHLIAIDTGNSYQAYFHQESALYYAKKLPPCKHWLQTDSIRAHSAFNLLLLGKFEPGNRSNILWEPLTHDKYRKLVDIHGVTFCFDLAEPLGLNEFNPLHEYWFKWANIVFLVFAVDDEQSLLAMENYYEALLSLKDEIPALAVIVVAANCDQNTDGQFVHIQRRAMTNALEWNIPYMEVSARHKVNIQLLYELCLYEYWLQCATDKNSPDL